jgi:hypothetical protein
LIFIFPTQGFGRYAASALGFAVPRFQRFSFQNSAALSVPPAAANVSPSDKSKTGGNNLPHSKASPGLQGVNDKILCSCYD